MKRRVIKGVGGWEVDVTCRSMDGRRNVRTVWRLMKASGL